MAPDHFGEGLGKHAWYISVATLLCLPQRDKVLPSSNLDQLTSLRPLVKTMISMTVAQVWFLCIILRKCLLLHVSSRILEGCSSIYALGLCDQLAITTAPYGSNTNYHSYG